MLVFGAIGSTPVDVPETCVQRGASHDLSCRARSPIDTRQRGASGRNIGTVQEPVVFVPTDRDEANLAILDAAGLRPEVVIRMALTSLAAECTPVVWALAASSTTSPSPV